MRYLQLGVMLFAACMIASPSSYADGPEASSESGGVPFHMTGGATPPITDSNGVKPQGVSTPRLLPPAKVAKKNARTSATRTIK
jgi:hypothetical protein